MDLEEWEFLPRVGGFIDLDEDQVRKIVHLGKRDPNPKNVFDMDYFICPSQDPREMIHPSSPTRRSRLVPTQLLQVPISWEPIIGDKGMEEAETEKEVTKSPIDITVVISTKIKNLGPRSFEADQDLVSQFSFKKTKENEFVDMNMDSPRSDSSITSSNLPQNDARAFAFDGITEREIESPPRKSYAHRDLGNRKEDRKESNEKLNIWKMSVTGIGAICSFGVAAAATICIIFLGSNQSKQQEKNQRRRFQIFTDDKRIKEVVHHATKLNEAISAARGVPFARAQISFGGYYGGLLNHSRCD